jgi:hypothetical protein
MLLLPAQGRKLSKFPLCRYLQRREDANERIIAVFSTRWECTMVEEPMENISLSPAARIWLSPIDPTLGALATLILLEPIRLRLPLDMLPPLLLPPRKAMLSLVLERKSRVISLPPSFNSCVLIVA